MSGGQGQTTNDFSMQLQYIENERLYVSTMVWQRATGVFGYRYPGSRGSVTRSLGAALDARSHGLSAAGETDTPRIPFFSMIFATSPEAFTSSMNSRRYLEERTRRLGAATACWTTAN